MLLKTNNMVDTWYQVMTCVLQSTNQCICGCRCQKEFVKLEQCCQELDKYHDSRHCSSRWGYVLLLHGKRWVCADACFSEAIGVCALPC